MKRACLVLPVMPVLLSACAMAGPGLPSEPLLPPPMDAPALPKPPDLSPRLVLPTGGGLPVIGLPLGGNFYLPASGGLPIVGVPLAP